MSIRLKYSPVTGRRLPLTVFAVAFRPQTPDTNPEPWLFNPWTGELRDGRDVEGDPYGMQIRVAGACPECHGAPNHLPDCPRLKQACEHHFTKVVRAEDNPGVRYVMCADCGTHLDHLAARPDGRVVLTKSQQTALDVQVGGSHYKDLAIQPVEYIHKNRIGYMEGNAIKYLTRWRQKNGVEDLKKARHYIDLLIEMESEAK